MPSYPAKPYIIPHDDWFNNNSVNLENKSSTKKTKNTSTVHEYFYRQSNIKVGGSDNHMQTYVEKKSSKKIITSSLQNSDKSFISTSKENYSYSKIPTKLKSIKKSSFEGNSFYKKLSNKKLLNFKSYLLDIKSFFLNIIKI